LNADGIGKQSEMFNELIKNDALSKSEQLDRKGQRLFVYIAGIIAWVASS
jgi:hypothetical protein